MANAVRQTVVTFATLGYINQVTLATIPGFHNETLGDRQRTLGDRWRNGGKYLINR